MNLSLLLFLIGVFGFVLNRKNIILMLISIEIMLLSITYLILINSLNFDDIVGQTFAIYIIIIAGAESAVGLGILVAFYRLRGTIAIDYISAGYHSYNPSLISTVNEKYKKMGVRNLSRSHSTGGINWAVNIQPTNNRLRKLNYKIKYK